MKINTFCWVILASLFIGSGCILYFMPNYTPGLGFLNLGALVVLLIAAFLFKHAPNNIKCNGDNGINTDVVSNQIHDIGRDSDSEGSQDPDPISESGEYTPDSAADN